MKDWVPNFPGLSIQNLLWKLIFLFLPKSDLNFFLEVPTFIYDLLPESTCLPVTYVGITPFDTCPKYVCWNQISAFCLRISGAAPYPNGLCCFISCPMNPIGSSEIFQRTVGIASRNGSNCLEKFGRSHENFLLAYFGEYPEYQEAEDASFSLLRYELESYFMDSLETL